MIRDEWTSHARKVWLRVKNINIERPLQNEPARAHKPCKGVESLKPELLHLTVDPESHKLKVAAIMSSQVQTNPEEQPTLQYLIA